MLVVRNLLLRFGESNLTYVTEKSTDFLGRLLHYYREKSQKVIRANTFVMPEGMKFLPYYIYCFKSSELLQKGKFREFNKVEVMRRELMQCEPLQFMLRIIPQIYSMGYYFEPKDTETEEFTIPPTTPPAAINIKDGGIAITY